MLRDRAALAAAENNEIIWVEHLEAQSAFEIRLRELP
ncbi:MAG: hypothetical protein LBP51_03005 [Deferribacteraceae bacterium]|nr:hypothetical protein [Deferribacteraceae bacterium]